MNNPFELCFSVQRKKNINDLCEFDACDADKMLEMWRQVWAAQKDDGSHHWNRWRYWNSRRCPWEVYGHWDFGRWKQVPMHQVGLFVLFLITQESNCWNDFLMVIDFLFLFCSQNTYLQLLGTMEARWPCSAETQKLHLCHYFVCIHGSHLLLSSNIPFPFFSRIPFLFLTFWFELSTNLYVILLMFWSEVEFKLYALAWRCSIVGVEPGTLSWFGNLAPTWDIKVLTLYFCFDRCRSYERAKKKLTVQEAPNILTICMKRFQVFDNPVYPWAYFILRGVFRSIAYFARICSQVNLESLISRFTSLRFWTWHHTWAVQVTNHLYTGSMEWWFTWISWMPHFLVTMCAT